MKPPQTYVFNILYTFYVQILGGSWANLAARIPNSHLIAQLLRPTVLGAIILISSQLCTHIVMDFEWFLMFFGGFSWHARPSGTSSAAVRRVLIFNQTSIPLGLRFASKPMLWTHCATADLLDGSAHLTESNVREGRTPGAVPCWLMPGGFASAPLEPPQLPEEEDEEEEAIGWEMMTEERLWGSASLTATSSFSCIEPLRWREWGLAWPYLGVAIRSCWPWWTTRPPRRLRRRGS